MPIVIPAPATNPDQTTTTIASIKTKVVRDLQDSFVNSGATNSLIIDYCNRIQQMILARRRWKWMLSDPMQFVTEMGQTDYWIGETGAGPAGSVDTGLNITDLRLIEQGAVYDRTSGVSLWRTMDAPLDIDFDLPDTSYGQGQPIQYLTDQTNPYLVRIFPAPDQGSSYELVPQPPHSVTTVSGALSARTYYLQVTFVDAAGNESAASTPAARQWIAASSRLTVKAPQPPITTGSAGIAYTHYNIYASETLGSETLQNVSVTAIGTDWQEAITGLTTSGAAAPSSSDIDPIDGYIVSFRYYKKHTLMTADTDVLLIPDEWAHVVVTGVNQLIAQYSKAPTTDVQYWGTQFEIGMRQMTQDENPWPTGGMFMKPDPATQRSRQRLWW